MVFMLGKLRYIIDRNTALYNYLQCCRLLYINYAGLLLVSCTQTCKKDLQTFQNNAIRMSLRYRLQDRVSILDLYIG